MQSGRRIRNMRQQVERGSRMTNNLLLTRGDLFSSTLIRREIGMMYGLDHARLINVIMEILVVLNNMQTCAFENNIF